MKASGKRLAKLSVVKCVDERVNDGITTGHKHQYVNGHVVVLLAGECEEIDDKWQPAQIEAKAENQEGFHRFQAPDATGYRVVVGGKSRVVCARARYIDEDNVANATTARANSGHVVDAWTTIQDLVVQMGY
jgi:hypothetical protein